MNGRKAYAIRAGLVLAERERGRSLPEVVAIFKLRGKEEARQLEARGRRLVRESAAAALPSCPHCASAGFRDEGRGVWCSNENCRAQIAS